MRQGPDSEGPLGPPPETVYVTVDGDGNELHRETRRERAAKACRAKQEKVHAKREAKGHFDGDGFSVVTFFGAIIEGFFAGLGALLEAL